MRSLFFLIPKFQGSRHLLCLYSPICDGPGRKPECWFSHDAAQIHFIYRRSPSDGMRPALDPIIENQPVIAVENDNDSGNDTLTAKNTVKENKAKEEVGNINKK